MTKTLEKERKRECYYLCDKIVTFEYQETEFDPIERETLQWFGYSTLGLDQTL